MDKVECPHCGKNQLSNPIKQWAYGKIKVNRYQCKCSKFFNHYTSTQSSWTIPRTRKH